MKGISIIIPVHNTEDYLRRCIDSILMTQEYPVEIIVVDNNSDHDYSSIINRYKDSVKFVALPHNLGPGGARNKWVEYATGDFIAFCDSDDWVDANFYDNIISEMLRYDADVGIGGIKRNFAYKSNERIVKCRFDKIHIIEQDVFFRTLTKEYDNGLLIPPSTVNRVYRRSFLERHNVLFSEGAFYEDLLFSIKISILAHRFVCVPNVFYHHFKRIGSITQSFTEKHVNDYQETFSDIRNFMKETKVYDAYKLNYYNFAEQFFNLLIRQLFEYEQQEEKRKAYLKKALLAFKQIIDFDEYIECNTAEDIRKHIQPLIDNTIIN